jgi:hypothetical protein
MAVRAVRRHGAKAGAGSELVELRQTAGPVRTLIRKVNQVRYLGRPAKANDRIASVGVRVPCFPFCVARKGGIQSGERFEVVLPSLEAILTPEPPWIAVGGTLFGRFSLGSIPMPARHFFFNPSESGLIVSRLFWEQDIMGVQFPPL